MTGKIIFGVALLGGVAWLATRKAEPAITVEAEEFPKQDTNSAPDAVPVPGMSTDDVVSNRFTDLNTSKDVSTSSKFEEFDVSRFF